MYWAFGDDALNRSSRLNEDKRSNIERKNSRTMQDSELNKKRDEIIAKVVEMPAMPAASIDLIAVIHDPDVTVDQLVGVMEHDQGLTANILRWANSVYFGGRHEVYSVRNAIVRLGLDQMKLVVIASIAAPMVRQQIEGYDLPPNSLLEHSIVAAIGTREIAEELGIEAPSYAFTAGLLHDIGKIVLGTFVKVESKPMMRMVQEEDITFDEAERRILGIDHAEVGALLLEGWKIPQSIVDVVRWHHEPDGFEGDSSVIDLVHVACYLSTRCGLGVGIDGVHYRLDESVAARIKISSSQYEMLAEQVLTGLSEVRESFSVA